ncbi:Txe/YoeB family addiction module toxin [Kaistella flava (ex Peng et al. 2021)]|uniref:Putative mRNA interferase YoeB n=1 Tax=Kaistella flava (ex Peng et al. 2021) TaxID=2038776 RepID=A0A7M2YE88_9FLAO|nr:Txe/YoeB family addiction module toxin [Kaistella flava (ex Peng et al. 2021)]QOW11974.1 Txe/YoeB family addiction module toxin [Kaistella flava (ex Peng et al. 2021)]
MFSFLEELTLHPYTGTGKPEALKHNLSGLWSRRINKEHRLIYEVKNEVILILSAYGHY